MDSRKPRPAHAPSPLPLRTSSGAPNCVSANGQVWSEIVQLQALVSCNESVAGHRGVAAVSLAACRGVRQRATVPKAPKPSALSTLWPSPLSTMPYTFVPGTPFLPHLLHKHRSRPTPPFCTSSPTSSSPSPSSSPRRPRRAPRDFCQVLLLPDFSVTLQTKVTHFTSASPQSSPTSLDLFSLVHFATPSYYTNLNTTLQNYDRVYFECITSAENLTSTTPLRVLRRPVGPSPAATAQARALGLVPQMRVFDSSLSNAFCADLTTSELAAASRASRPAPAPAPAFALLRAAACLLPAPEAAALLVDALQRGPGAVSPPALAFAIFPLIVRGDVSAARRMLFAHAVAASTRERGDLRVGDAAVRSRNLRVLEAVREGGGESVAVVYGAWHSGHLVRMFETELGFEYAGGKWMEIVVEGQEEGREWVPFLRDLIEGRVGWSDLAAGPVLKVMIVLASCVTAATVLSAVDYVQTFVGSVRILADVGVPWAEKESTAIEAILYVIRHSALYYFLGNWILADSETFV